MTRLNKDGSTLPTTEDLLAERGATHGDYAQHARISQRLKAIIEEELRLCKGDLNPMIDGRARTAVNEEWNFIISESIDMILHKIGRIVAGDATHRDHWADVAGYSQLVVNALNPPTSRLASFKRAVDEVSKLKESPGLTKEFYRDARKLGLNFDEPPDAPSAAPSALQRGFEEEMTRSLK